MFKRILIPGIAAGLAMLALGMSVHRIGSGVLLAALNPPSQ